MPISDKKFTEAIGNISDHYEAIKDICYANFNVLDKPVQDLLGELVKLRDIACISLRESHTTKNFDRN